jgi:hypothetical protein
MGPPENLTRRLEGQASPRRKRPVRRPRHCLLKGCEHWFRPWHVRQRYCSEECRQGAREWSKWKARQVWRATAEGKRKRNGQSRRYRERLKNRKPPDKLAVAETARVITKKFFRWLL